MEGQIQRNIKDCRDALVGKVPNPIEQVQQITLALIYKFMSDLDQQVIDIDGKATYFTEEYEKYSWNNLMSPRLQFQEKYNLYSEGIDKLKTHPKLTDVFRKVFKDAYLPYRDPATLVNFLSIINRFNYDDSEILGEAFESLLNTMGSQGDAGQFRTPRHIIDFILDIIEPNKTDTILDPACGTAGFLISAFKYIIKSNLKPQEKQALTENIVGYDIAPVMAEISAVNLYLHGFKNPKIFEYDTLTSTDKWQDKFDIILANPPFMTPKGGIKPHNLFELKANRAEVLFSEYIMEHLKSTGRAGFIVPEGIIFKSENAYKTLRKNFITQGLYCVVSLPSGVFQPYSGVKTSIIFIDKKLKGHNKDILFINIKNDGFDLGAQRKPIKDNDLPQAIEIVKEFKNCISKGNLEEFKNKNITNKNISVVNVEEVGKGGDYNLSANRYIKEDVKDCKISLVMLSEKIKFLNKSTRKAGDGLENGLFPFFTSSQTQNKFLNEADYKDECLILGTGGNATVHLSSNFSTSADNFIITSSNTNELNNKFLYYFLLNNKSILENGFKGIGIKHLSKEYLNNIQIPLPPLEIQEKIVAEIEEYEKIINGAKEVVDNWKPKIEVSKDWEMVKLDQIVDVKGGKRIPKGKNFSEEKTNYPYIRVTDFENLSINLDKLKYINENIFNEIKNYTISKNDIYLSIAGTIGLVGTIPDELDNKSLTENAVKLIIKNDKQTNKKYLVYILNIDNIQNTIDNKTKSVGVPKLSIYEIKTIQIPLPPIEIQQQIVARIEEEQKYIDGCKKLIEIYEGKIKNTIKEVIEE